MVFGIKSIIIAFSNDQFIDQKNFSGINIKKVTLEHYED